MAHWKSAGVAAGAVLLFAAVKIVPWAFGFAGGKHLYETVAGRHNDPARLTTAQVSEQLQNQDFQIFKAIKQEFPDDYDAIVQKITTVAQSGGSSADVSNASRVSVADLRKKYAPLLLSAPERSATEALGAQLDMLNHVMAKQPSATCDRYVRKDRAPSKHPIGPSWRISTESVRRSSTLSAQQRTVDYPRLRPAMKTGPCWLPL